MQNDVERVSLNCFLFLRVGSCWVLLLIRLFRTVIQLTGSSEVHSILIVLV